MIHKLHILANSEFLAKDFAKKVNLMPQNFVYVYDVRNIAGWRDGVLLLIGNYYERKDSEYIVEVAKAHNFAIIKCEW